MTCQTISSDAMMIVFEREYLFSDLVDFSGDEQDSRGREFALAGRPDFFFPFSVENAERHRQKVAGSFEIWAYQYPMISRITILRPPSMDLVLGSGAPAANYSGRNDWITARSRTGYGPNCKI